MKKTTLILNSLLIASIFISSCGEDKSEASASEETKTTEEKSTKTDDEKTVKESKKIDESAENDEAIQYEETSSSKTITVGNQVWMTKNLNVDKFRNGEPIQQAKSAKEWERANANQEAAWCYYNNDPKNGAIYGKLYNWYAVNDPRGLAPEGYHVPSQQEAYDLNENIMHGGYLKSKKLWDSPNTSANNKTGFSAIPGGWRGYGSTFYDLGHYCFFWTSSEDRDMTEFVKYFMLTSISENLSCCSGNYRGTGYSVRCLED